MDKQVCPQCQYVITQPGTIRCPRCNKLLIASCSGSCSRCKEKGKCGG
ncbi:hypothetical protein [Thermosinus carboxydivorans]|nr:hypothetical protein [Thermosinus carboxydivorans]